MYYVHSLQKLLVTHAETHNQILFSSSRLSGPCLYLHLVHKGRNHELGTEGVCKAEMKLGFVDEPKLQTPLKTMRNFFTISVAKCSQSLSRSPKFQHHEKYTFKRTAAKAGTPTGGQSAQG